MCRVPGASAEGSRVRVDAGQHTQGACLLQPPLPQRGRPGSRCHLLPHSQTHPTSPPRQCRHHSLTGPLPAPLVWLQQTRGALPWRAWATLSSPPIPRLPNSLAQLLPRLAQSPPPLHPATKWPTCGTDPLRDPTRTPTSGCTTGGPCRPLHPLTSEVVTRCGKASDTSAITALKRSAGGTSKVGPSAPNPLGPLARRSRPGRRCGPGTRGGQSVSPASPTRGPCCGRTGLGVLRGPSEGLTEKAFDEKDARAGECRQGTQTSAGESTARLLQNRRQHVAGTARTRARTAVRGCGVESVQGRVPGWDRGPQGYGCGMGCRAGSACGALGTGAHFWT